MTTPETLTVDIVTRVYSGLDGRCACGCSGKYWYNSRYAATAAEQRGYALSDDKINDCQVSRVVNIIRNNAQAVYVDDEFMSVVVGSRIFVAYTI